MKEPNLAPDDGQRPKDDESLLNDVGAGDRRHRLSFTVKPHERKNGGWAGFQARVRDARIRGTMSSKRLIINAYVTPNYSNNGKGWPLFPIAIPAV